jgi:repressor LexA
MTDPRLLLLSPGDTVYVLRGQIEAGETVLVEGQAVTVPQRLGLGHKIARVAVAAGGLVETFDDIQERLDLAPVLDTRGLFALTVNGDSMVDAHIADGDVVLLEPVSDPSRLKAGTIVSALVPGSGTTLKHFHRSGATVTLEAANPAYDPIVLPADQVTVQGKLVAVWRQV